MAENEKSQKEKSVAGFGSIVYSIQLDDVNRAFAMAGILASGCKLPLDRIAELADDCAMALKKRRENAKV